LPVQVPVRFAVLRSPIRLPDLASRSPVDQLRVESANKLYSLVASVAAALVDREVVWSIENPRSSIVWDIPCVASLLGLAGVDDVLFAHCMFGGTRNKVTRLRCWPAQTFVGIAKFCDGGHVHAPWGRTGGVFATAQETAYPEQLCIALARSVASFLDLGDLPRLSLDARKRNNPSNKKMWPLIVVLPVCSRAALVRRGSCQSFAKCCVFLATFRPATREHRLATNGASSCFKTLRSPRALRLSVPLGRGTRGTLVACGRSPRSGAALQR